MKILGLIGGTSWLSTVEYYTYINQGINKRLGELNYAECMLYSFNFQKIKENNDANDWETNFKMILAAAEHLQRSGAHGIVLCANTMHYVADQLQDAIDIPVIHIATATANAIKQQGIKKVGLMGTKFTMENGFFISKLEDQGIEALIPEDASDRDFLHNTIFDELGRSIFKPETKSRYLAMIEGMKARGATGFIAGCTEIPLIIKDTDIDLAYFDTLYLHAQAAIEFSLSECV